MSRSALFCRLQRLVVQARVARGLPGSGTSRRELLSGLAAGFATPLVACSDDDDAPEGVTVAIVGGGIAGVHVAFRLAQAGVNCTLFEATDRLGGRMFTGRGLFTNGHLCELGGEFVDSNHATLWALSDLLGIALDDLEAGAYAALKPDVFWIAGVEISEETLLTQLEATVDGIAADYAAAESDDEAFAALDAEPLDVWLERRIPVATYPELHEVLRVAYVGEFGLEADRQSALNLVYLVGLETDELRLFGQSDERYHAHDGSDTFVSEMAALLPVGAVLLSHALVRAAGVGPYTLTFDASDGELERTFDHVVFALPFSVLRQLDTEDLDLSADKRAIVDELGYGTNAKLMGELMRPVWRDDYGASGATTTDLAYQQSWDSSLGQTGPGAILTNFVGGDQGVAIATLSADDWATTVLLPGIEPLFPGTSAAWVAESAVRMHWPTVPTALGSFTCYRPGQWSFWGTEGLPEGGLHFCGEHTSADFQGWMEGGAESGARVALEVLDALGVAAPESLARLAVLRRELDSASARAGGTPLRRLRARREVLRAWAEVRPRGARAGAR